VYCANGDYYRGDIKDGKREGWGWLTPNNGGSYDGLFGSYDGLFKNDKLEGAVKCWKDHSSAYEYFIFEKNNRGEPST